MNSKEWGRTHIRYFVTRSFPVHDAGRSEARHQETSGTNGTVCVVKNTKHNRLRVKMINIQGLSQTKTTEIENEIGDDTIFCVTETQHKFQRTHFQDGTKAICSWREEKDKKGGGLMLLHKSSSTIESMKMDSRHPDILYAKCKFQAMAICIVLIYMSTNDKARNKEIKQKAEAIIKKEEEHPLLILGDFNGHLGFLGPQQCDENGRMVVNWLDEHNLVLLNADPNCTGETTWSRGEQKSSIDFMLVNQKLYQNFYSMDIDEDKSSFDLSDHHMIEAQFQMPFRRKEKQVTEDVNYLKISEDTSADFKRRLEMHLQGKPSANIEELNNNMKSIADTVMKRTFKKRTDCREKLSSPLWFNANIKKEISKRRELNKNVRKATAENRNALKYLYNQQKQKVTFLVRAAIKTHEEKVAEDIMTDRNRSKKMWSHINSMINKPQRSKKETNIYDKHGEKMVESSIPSALKESWQGIYQKHKNEIPSNWNTEEKNTYAEKHAAAAEDAKWIQTGPEGSTLNIPVILREHIDAAVAVVTQQCQPMNDETVTEEEIKTHLNKLKKKKAPGPDGLKSELYKIMSESSIFVKQITENMNKIIKDSDIPNDWKKSNTILIPKKSKPTATDLRPIALLNISYKLFMSIIKSKIERYLKECGVYTELQAGFTEKRRTSDNLYIIKYCIDEAYKQKKQMYVISIDFQKAFDSVNRGKLIDIMKTYRLHPSIIDVVANIYCGDVTNLYLNNKYQTDMEVTCGVRQGCNGSTTLFLMVTFMIINKLQEARLGFRNKFFNISSLFYADDGLILAQNYQDAKAAINILIQVANKCGLQLNKNKSMIMVYNVHPNETPSQIEGIQMVNQIKYLGFVVINKKNCLSDHKNNNLMKAKKMTNILHSIVARSYLRIKMGKTYWKGLAMPIFLYGAEVVNYNQSDLKELQKVDNKAYRTILQAPNYTAVEGLRGDIGASSSISRDMKTKILFVKHLLDDDNDLARSIFFNEYKEQTTTWSKIIAGYMQELKLTLTKVSDMTSTSLAKLVREWDTQSWLKGMQNKETLKVYGKYKTNVKEEIYFTNDEESKLMFRARTNTIDLNWRRKREQNDKKCPKCEQVETLQHFLLDCNSYNEIRAQHHFLTKPFIENTDEIIANFLLLKKSETETDGDINTRKRVLQEMWKKRNEVA